MCGLGDFAAGPGMGWGMGVMVIMILGMAFFMGAARSSAGRRWASDDH